MEILALNVDSEVHRNGGKEGGGHGLNALSSKTHVEALTLNVMVFGSGAFGR
jgi:hypothetical protein